MNFRAFSIMIFFIVCCVSVLHAGNVPPPPPAPGPPPGLPIPGIVVFMAGAVFFGMYKILKQPKK